MDSGNSGSLQSSSGGDDEFDSRGGGGGAGGGGGVDSSPLSALLRPSPSPSAAAFSLHGNYFGLQEFTSAPPQQQQQQQAGAWSGSFAGASGLSSSSSPHVAHVDAGAGARTQGAEASDVAAAQGQGAGMGAPAPPQPPRGSRKRTRASRRAPTTVLTTDTSNFRAMVQEFTGIPSPPFGAGVGVGLGGPAASLRTRFDHIFPPPSSLRTGAGGSAADAAAASLPPYLLRPFPHKLPTVPSSFPPFTSSSSSSTPSSSNPGAANANAATGTATTAAASSNPAAPVAAAGAGDAFQQLTSSALLRLQQDPSSFLSFQNLLDSQPSSQSIFGVASGFGHPSRLHDPSPSPSDFLAGVGSSNLGLTHGGLLGSEGLHLHHSRSDVHGHGGDELSGLVAAGASGGSCKPHYSSHAGAVTSSSGAASADKPPDGGPGAPGRPGRSDGLDPWICTSE